MTSLTLALDAMGGDFGPRVTVPATLQALRFHAALHVILVGDSALIRLYLKDQPQSLLERITIRHTDQVVEMADKPIYALRYRKQSSMRLAIEAVRDGEAQACVSAGNTGALMAISKVLLKTLTGIDRPALVSRLPAINNQPVYMLDLGANVSCNAKSLFQFALMGSVLSETIDDRQKPRVALLNVGIEEMKGNEQVQAAAQMLQQTPQVNYVGFIEGNALYSGDVDVIVCDGFVGNITLKTSEGIARLLMQQLKKGLKQGFFIRLLSKFIAPRIRSVLNKMNPDHYNGATLLGLRAIVIKSHGSADEAAYLRSINLAVTEAQRRLPQMIAQRLESILLDIKS